MYTHDWKVDVVEQFVMIFDGHARAEKDHDFFLLILFQEREQKKKTLLRRNNNITLFNFKSYL